MSTSQRSRGALIVLEGLDRSGKTTQVKRLGEKLLEAGHDVKTMRFPDRTTPIGQLINTYLTSSTSASFQSAPLNDQAIHLLFSANRWELAPEIHRLLASGVTVLLDRYYYSGMIYTAAKRIPGLSLEWARGPDVGLPRPDMVVFLDLLPEVQQQRGGFGEERYEKAGMQREVRRLFHTLIEERHDDTSRPLVPERKMQAREGAEFDAGPGSEMDYPQEEEDMWVVDAAGTVDEVAEKIWEVVEPRIEQVRQGELGTNVRRVTVWTSEVSKHVALELVDS